jgi:hypothetical protein
VEASSAVGAERFALSIPRNLDVQRGEPWQTFLNWGEGLHGNLLRCWALNKSRVQGNGSSGDMLRGGSIPAVCGGAPVSVALYVLHHIDGSFALGISLRRANGTPYDSSAYLSAVREVGGPLLVTATDPALETALVEFLEKIQDHGGRLRIV